MWNQDLNTYGSLGDIDLWIITLVMMQGLSIFQVCLIFVAHNFKVFL